MGGTYSKKGKETVVIMQGGCLVIYSKSEVLHTRVICPQAHNNAFFLNGAKVGSEND